MIFKKNKDFLFNYKKKKLRNKSTFAKNKDFYFYYPVYYDSSDVFFDNIKNDVYNINFFWIQTYFINIKYFRFTNIIKNKLAKINNLNTNSFKKIKIYFLLKFFFNYKIFLKSLNIDLFYLIKNNKNEKNNLINYLILSFKKNKFFLTLINKKKKTNLTLSSGFFIKFFENKKSFKKNKTIKILMAKYIRKIFLITKIIDIILIIKKTPKFLNEIITFLNTPIIHKFINPINKKFIEETNEKNTKLNFLYFFFFNNKNFTKNKIPKKGRIKRKILRKITFENKLID